ncbi:hypothetical protein ACVQMG_000528 [Enterobacter roggenkampii]
MQLNPKTFVSDGVSIPLPVLVVQVGVAPDFTGRVVLHLRDGRLIAERRLLDSEHISTLEGFLELAHLSGWAVTPPPSTD